MKYYKTMYKRIFSQGLLFLALLIFSNKESKAQITTIIDSLNAEISHHHYDTICPGDTLIIGTIPPPGGDQTAGPYQIVNVPYNPDPYTGANCFTTTEDDAYTATIPIGFNFCYYNGTSSNNTCLCSSNGVLSFDVSNANFGLAWVISNPIPSPSDPLNCVMGPWQDLQTFSMVNWATCLQYAVYGQYPYRRFVFSLNNEAYYSCTNLNHKGQLVLYESTNVVDVRIDHKDVCAGWNGGYAIEGLNDATGANGTVVPGRNYPTQWTVTTPECKRFIPPNPPPVMTWTGPSAISTQNGPTQWTETVAPIVTTTYIISLPYSCDQTVAADTFTIVMRSNPPAMFQTPDSCGNHVGVAWAVPVGNGPFSYIWSPTGGNNQTATGLGFGLYTCTVDDLSSGCVSTATITVDSVSALSAIGTITSNVTCFGGTNGGIFVTPSGVGPYSYLWSPTGATSQTVSNLPAGNYTCIIVNPNNLGCQAHVYETITQPPVLTVVAGPYSPPFCSYILTGADTADAVGGTPPYTYNWSNGSANAITTNLVTGSYTVTITDANGCTTSAASSVSIPSYLAIITGPNDSICQNDSTQIEVLVTGGYTPYSYSWNNPAFGNPTYVHPATTTNYMVTVTDSKGCTIVSNYITVSVNPTPDPVFSGSPLEGCAPLSVQFIDHSTCIQPIIKWKWNFGDGTNYSDSASPQHIYTTSGLFSVSMTVTSSGGCSATLTDSAYVDAYPSPVARFLINPNITSLLSPEITFTDRSQGADTVAYEFGDGNSSDHRNVFHSYNDTGEYWITQTVYNQYGCMDSTTGNVIITSYYTFYIPNSFTPALNGLNNFFQPYGTGITDFSMNIFDRWGELIFSSTNIDQPWDGKVNGSIAPEGTYVYEINIKDNTQTAHEYVGKLNLIR